MSDAEETVVRIDVPLDHHPKTVQGESPGAQAGRAALEVLYDAYGRVNTAAAEVKDLGRLATVAQPFVERAISKADRQLQRLRSQADHLDQEINEAITPKQSDAVAAEIRAHWKTKAGTGKTSSAKIFGELSALVRAGDLTTTSAVLSGLPYLSGLEPEQQAQLRVQAAEANVPEQVQARAETAKAIKQVDNALTGFTNVMVGRINTWGDADSKVLEKLNG